MKVREGIDVDADALARICARYGIRELSLFGSALGPDFGPDSDIDLLYVLDEDAHLGWEIVDLAVELEALFGRPVDLVGRRSIHWLIRDEVLATARLLHAA
jgi:predicted nucleotidyltransferase